jgi:ABC-2 type transport system ATP-binding protein
VVAIVAIVALGLVVSVVRAITAPPIPLVTDLRLPGGPTSATDATPVELDARLYLPPQTPAPAVLVAHGFGGSRDSVAEQAQGLAERGFAVLAYSARGFGGSTGQISMNAPDFEVADAAALVDWLATRPEITLDGPDDPRVGVAGGSYGGALALLLAGYDARVDAVAADITWNDLQTSLFGQSGRPVDGPAPPGVYKDLWTGLFFSAGLEQPGGEVTTCGRFTAPWCEAYTEAATAGTVSADSAALMATSSPAGVLSRITAPTLLGAGLSDSLFPLAQANATVEALTADRPDLPVKAVWHAGGHDGGIAETERLLDLTAAWFAAHLANGPAVSTDTEVSLVSGSALSDRAQGSVTVLSVPGYPGLDGDEASEYQVVGPPQRILAPAGGVPAAISSLPGLGGLASLASAAGLGVAPQQTATFVGEPLAAAQRVVGAPRVRLSIAADTEVSDVTLFASLRIVGPQGRLLLPNGLVAPIRLDRVGPEPVLVEVELPGIVTEASAGDRLAVVVGTTDQAYRLPAGPAVYTVAVDGPVTLPSVSGAVVGGGLPAWTWLVVGIGVAALAWLVVVLLRPRYRRDDRGDPDVPLVVDDLAKEFPGGVRAVDGVSFTVPRGVVLGLLGPNGAGKSTTMRMMMGLIEPTAGRTLVFGEQVHSGAPALARIGCFIEGPGLLPHLTGRQNLDLFWRASGRTGDQYLDEVLDIAGLGSAIDRTVRTYSQGMKQRLGIAQAMLGLPDLLVLDEPTNGLDPPQIKEMRQVVQDYAKDGRTVIISSHLLAEVEQACSHVVVMSRGRVIAEGRVEDLLAGRAGARLEDVFLEMVGTGHTVVTS